MDIANLGNRITSEGRVFLRQFSKVSLGRASRFYKAFSKQKGYENLTYVHVGKCGGSYITSNLPNLRSIHMQKPIFDINQRYIFWLRDPIKRFVSAFNHSLSIIEFDISGYDENSLYHASDTPYYKLPNKIHSKLATGHPFAEWPSGKRYEKLIKLFGTANDLAESLTSTNPVLKTQAEWLMRNTEVEHIGRGLGWYTDNGNFIAQHYKNILFVGTQENMQEDMRRLCVLLNVNCPHKQQRIRAQAHVNNRYLSKRAICNIKEFYKYSDYAALNVLKEHNLITEETYLNYLN
ncbi:hypothetical protein [Thalassotalea sp. PS06]|uniref:hypothetical protein n=1 Tax=Thalassotalea sp. PS06 TaxID=2594005 RepID=UPI001165A7C7|nr:hypothetical protein [Thalassotalea sp. PS06]QDP02297.1 hypothetical protein FNC98_13665 [Thalassotalea sp. PS06]